MLTTLALAVALTGPSSLPADLVGEWRYTSIRGTTYWDASSNAYLGHGGGNSSTLVFEKDGGFKEYVYLENSLTASWTTKVFTTKEGRAEVEGDILRTSVKKGRYKTQDNRVARYNIDRAMTEADAKKLDREYRYALATEKGVRILTLKVDGATMRYERVR